MNKLKSKPKYLDFEVWHKKQLKDSKYSKEFEKLQPEFDLIQAMIDARIKKGITQKILAKRMKTKQSVISRLESGNANPSFKFVKRLADALETDIKITFTAS